jgi:hypothetical protein
MSSLTQKIFHPSAEAKHSDDEVWLMDNTAVRSAPTAQDWKAEFVVAFFKDNEDIRKKITIALADLAQALKLAPNDDATEARLRERIAPFLRQIGPNMEVDVQYRSGTGGKLHLGPSESNGIYSAVVPLPSGTNALQASPGESWKMNVVHEQQESPAENSPTAHLETGSTFFAEDGGWGVISDIDDTIKVTEVRDRIKLLKHTFVDLPTAVQGMPDLYKGLRDALSTTSHPAPFMYLSASPYNLYPLLRGFVREAGFPGGTIILREMSWMDMESFVMSLTKGTQEYKTDRMVCHDRPAYLVSAHRKCRKKYRLGFPGRPGYALEIAPKRIQKRSLSCSCIMQFIDIFLGMLSSIHIARSRD